MLIRKYRNYGITESAKEIICECISSNRTSNMRYIIKMDGHQPGKTFGPYDTMEDAKAKFNDMVTAFEEGLDDINELAVVNEEHTSYYAEWKDGDWFSLDIVEE